MKGQGGHSHNDQLSFELNIKGKDIIIDPGSYTYSGSALLRNFDRSTSNHNTVSIEDIEQNSFGQDIFSMQEETFAKKIYFSSNEFVGEHYGYSKKINSIHRRNVFLNEKSIIVNDTLISNDIALKAYQNFILNPDVRLIFVKGILALVTEDLTIYSNIKKEDCIVEDTYVARAYGERILSKKIRIPFKERKEVKFYLH